MPAVKAKRERIWLLIDLLGIGTSTKLYLGPNGQPMIYRDDLRQAILIRSERCVDFLYYFYLEKLGRHDIPSASAIKALQRVLAGFALRNGAEAEDKVTADPLLDTLLAILAKRFKKSDTESFTLPDLSTKLNIEAKDVGYDTKDLPTGTAELSKQVRERIEALEVLGYTVEFPRTNSARYVEFTKIDWVSKDESGEEESEDGQSEETDISEEEMAA